MNRGVCKGCGQVILWVKTEKGKNMPLDPEPKKMIMVCTGIKQAEFARTIDAYTPHWATCPKAPLFKKKGPK